MVYLLLAVACSTLLGFLFKLFPRFGVEGFQAIVFNYFTCVACATLHLGHFPVRAAEFSEKWMPFGIGLGLIFITSFNAVRETVRNFGVTVAQVSQKMTLMASVPFAILVCGEPSSAAKMAGVVLAIAAIVFVNWKDDAASKSENSAGKLAWLMLFITWSGSALIDMAFVFLQNRGLIGVGNVPFIATIFGTAGVVGFAVAALGWATGRLKFSWKNVAAGVLLGIPNYGSILFTLKGLASGMGGSVFFPLNNVGIILASAAGAVFLFGEKFSRLNWLGIALAVAAIGLIAA